MNPVVAITSKPKHFGSWPHATVRLGATEIDCYDCDMESCESVTITKLMLALNEDHHVKMAWMIDGLPATPDEVRKLYGKHLK